MRGRREFLQLLGVGGAVFASGLGAACERMVRRPDDDFYFVQLSDTHWGYKGPANPDSEVTLPRAVERVNALPRRPDFVVFTGDLTHTTDDGAERRSRMARFQQLAAGIRAPVLRFIPGEHDASLDRGQAFEERFGPTRWSFDHKGVHFVALDNVSDPEGSVGEAQRDWLHKDLKAVDAEVPVVVFTHRPLFDLYPQWDWATKDGAHVVEVLSQRRNLTVFYGHIHQENHHLTGHIAHHAVRSLIFPLPPPGSQPKRAPVPWDPQLPGRGLGFRGLTERAGIASAEEIPLSPQESPAAARAEAGR